MIHTPLVEIFCDGNEKIGYGHIRRSKALAYQLIKENIQVRLTGLSKTAKQLLPIQNINSQIAGIVIFDSMEGIDNKIKEARELSQFLVTLDWFGNEVPDVNIAVYPHNEVRAAYKKFVGFEYIIIRDEIASLEGKISMSAGNKALVCIGGGDILNQGYHAACSLFELGYEVTLIQGPLVVNKLESKKFRVLINPPDYPELLQACNIAVTNGGGCLFEALCLGKPTFVLPQTEFEQRIGDFVKEKGAILGIGIESLRKVPVEELEKVSSCGEKLIDGKGLGRIAGIIKDILWKLEKNGSLQ